MAEDDRTGDQGGFDDWLDEDAGPDTDPYASLADDDTEAEIAEWMAFTQGDGDQSEGDQGEGDEGDGDDVVGDPSGEPESPAEVLTPSATDGGPAELEAAPAGRTETESASGDVDRTEPAAVASTDGTDSDEASDPDDDDRSGDEDATLPPGWIDFDDDDETAEIPLATPDADSNEPATSVDVAEFVGDGRADTDEVPILAGADVVAASMVNDTDESKTKASMEDLDALSQFPAISVPEGEQPDIEPDAEASEEHGESDDDDDTGEIDTEEIAAVSMAAASADVDDLATDVDDDEEDTGELEVVTADDEDDSDLELVEPSDDEDQDPDGAESDDEPFDISREHFLQTATREHEGLAAAIAEAETEETEQVALAAPIPGLESTVVGFDDVVEAEGHRKARARGSGNLVARVITAIALIAALGASLIWRPALLILATVVFVIGAGEFYTALTRTGRHPIALFGFAGIIGATVGAYFSGAIAITTAFVLIITVLLLYYAVVPGRQDPMGNLALTITVMVWVGLGSYAMLIAVSENWRPLVVATVVLVAAMDIAQYFVGRAIGRHQLAPWVSPKKTVEGLVGGVIVALGLGALLHFVEPFELTSGLVLGATVAVLAPLGDLAMSAAKRSLDIKDMGSVLPGHGGFLDRIDGLLFVIPAAWAIFLWAGLL